MTLHRRRHRIDVAFDQMICDDVSQLLKPEFGKRSKHFAFAFDRRWQYAVESRDAIGGDDQQAVVVYGVDVAHFSASN